MISISSTGSTKNLEKFLASMQRRDHLKGLDGLAKEGVNALSAGTPTDSGLARDSWDYEIVDDGRVVTIAWQNHDIENGFPVVIMLQYGHGTGTGGWVEGQDFINPAIRPIFDKIVDKVWKAVKSA